MQCNADVYNVVLLCVLHHMSVSICSMREGTVPVSKMPLQIFFMMYAQLPVLYIACGNNSNHLHIPVYKPVAL